MTTLTLTVPASYGYVIGVAAASVFVNQWHGMRVGGYRKAAKVEYPNAYANASDATKSMEKYQFNCAQRAHQNFLEYYAGFLVLMLTGGVVYPQTAAGLGVVWLVGRILYAVGYTRPQRDGGKGRYQGSVHYIGLLGLAGLSFTSAYKMLF